MDQINARFLDKPAFIGGQLVGSYDYANLHLVLTQIVQQDGKKIQVYVHGTMHKDSHVMLTFKKGLPKGEYILCYKAGFTKDHPERKLIVSLYADKEIELTKLDEKTYNR